jgi:hypothetical protein
MIVAIRLRKRWVCASSADPGANAAKWKVPSWPCVYVCAPATRQNQQIAKSIRGNGEEEEEALFCLPKSLTHSQPIIFAGPIVLLLSRKREAAAAAKNIHAALCSKVVPTRVYNKNERADFLSRANVVGRRTCAEFRVYLRYSPLALLFCRCLRLVGMLDVVFALVCLLWFSVSCQSDRRQIGVSELRDKRINDWQYFYCLHCLWH